MKRESPDGAQIQNRFCFFLHLPQDRLRHCPDYL